jgi:MEMO1 family protein
VKPPTLEEVRATMGIPSRAEDLRGQRDTIGYASRAGQMDAVWSRALAAPAPAALGRAPAPGVAALLVPHDDFVYSARVLARTLPLVTAKTVVVIGPFHAYARFGIRERLLFEPYRAWAAADGPVRLSPLRLEAIAKLPDEDFEVSPLAHDQEHSLEGVVIALRHLRPDLEIVPVLVTGASFEHLGELADDFGTALSDAMRDRGLVLGRDVALVISTDAVHYGADFDHTPFGPGDADAVRRATARDRALLTGPLAGTLTGGALRRVYETFVDPASPDTYRLTWCGRFAVPFGLMVLDRMALADGHSVVGHPLSYTTTVDAPPLDLKDLGLGATAPASPTHFVGLPAAAFTLDAGKR